MEGEIEKLRSPRQILERKLEDAEGVRRRLQIGLEGLALKDTGDGEVEKEVLIVQGFIDKIDAAKRLLANTAASDHDISQTTQDLGLEIEAFRKFRGVESDKKETGGGIVIDWQKARREIRNRGSLGI